MKTTWMLLHILVLVAGSLSHARERIEFYNGTRQMGMGGVTVATVNDETALIANPAALGKIRQNYFTIADPELSGSTNDLGIMSKGGGSSLDFTEPQKLLDKLNQSPDKYFHAMGQASPSFIATNFGIGVYGKYLYDAEVVSSSATYEYLYQNDLAAVVGFNFRLWEGRIKFGFNGKIINRDEINVSLPSNSTGLTTEALVKEGVGFGSDVGMLLTAPWTYLPSVGAVWRDVGATSFNLSDGGLIYHTQERPSPQYQVVDAGFSLSPILSNRIRMQIGGEYRDVMTSGDETDQMRRVHVGVELNLGDLLFLRGGMNQRYWTAGFEFTTSIFQLQFSTYGEEIGTATETREDRRYTGKFAIRF